VCVCVCVCVCVHVCFVCDDRSLGKKRAKGGFLCCVTVIRITSTAKIVDGSDHGKQTRFG
jgi:hypothetical protein